MKTNVYEQAIQFLVKEAQLLVKGGYLSQENADGFEEDLRHIPASDVMKMYKAWRE